MKEPLECAEGRAEERNDQLTGKVCREAPHQPELLGRLGRTRSCRSACSTQPGPSRTQSPRSLLQTHLLCNLSPRAVRPSCKHLGWICSACPLLCTLRTLLPAASPSLRFAGRKQAAVLTACDSAGTSAAVRKPSSTTGFQHRLFGLCDNFLLFSHCGIISTGEHSSTIRPPWDVSELLKPTRLFHTATTVSFFPPKEESPCCSPPLRFVSATPAFGWVQNPVQKELPDRN